MKLLAQPDYSNSVVNIYSLPGGNLVTTVQLPNSGPNGVILYRDLSAGTWTMFVSYAPSNGLGVVDIFDFTSINLATAMNTPEAKTSLSLDDGAVGLAIQPGTGDLYVATLNLSEGDAGVGVFGFTRTSGYAQASRFQFSSFNDAYNDVAQLCANLAFDLHDNLWMTTFQAGLGNQYLICYTQVNSTAGSSSHFLKIGNGATTLTTTKLPPSTTSAPTAMVPFSQPEGIAFDPAGNLWVGNNNDDFSTNGDGNGTLLKISQKWITDNLLNYTSLRKTLGADGYGGTRFIASNDADVTVYYLNDAKFGGLSFDGFTLYAHDQNAGGDATNAVVWQFETDLALSAATFKTSGIPTSYPGNGGMAIFETAPASLLIRDVATDTGAEPDTFIVGNFCWESPDIAVTQTSIAVSLPAPNTTTPAVPFDLSSDAKINGGSTAFAYVRVSNHGNNSTTGSEVIKLFWSKASAGLNWPAPWDGLQFDSTAGNPPLGGLIGAQKLGTISPGNETFVEFKWVNVPDSSKYSVNDQHFCLVARIEAASLYPFGMTYPEHTLNSLSNAIIYNTQNNSKIGWRNVTIVGSVAPGIHRGPIGPIHLGVVGANYSSLSSHFRFAVEMLGKDGQPAAIKGELLVHADGVSLARLLEMEIENCIFKYLGDGRFHLHDLIRGLENIRIHPNEILPFRVVFTPEEDIRDFAVRVVQYDNSCEGPKVIGGQTFVVGNVAGFPVR